MSQILLGYGRKSRFRMILLLSSYRSSLTEMNVLSDCLSIAKNKNVMVLDKIESSTSADSKTPYLLSTRKVVHILFLLFFCHQ